jgi:hypothetical protein
MRNFLQLLVILALLGGPGAAGAQDIRINPVPPGLKPQWTQVPGAPQVSYAPNLPTDVFRYRGKYYLFWENYFYRSSAPQGPWQAVTKVPQVFYNVDPAYFKTVRKAGEAPAAPGGPAPSPKGKMIDIPSTAPPAQAIPTTEPPAPADPEPPGAPAKLPKVM